MHDRHINRERYFNEQVETTEKHVVPYIELVYGTIGEDKSVLEIGCGEGGNLKPFLDRGCPSMGIDLSESKIENGKKYFAGHPHEKKITLIAQDIYLIDPNEDWKFDVIFLRDTIEHIPDQERFMGYMKRFMKKDSVVFFGFPPWQSPFGGHQQVCRSRFLSKLPYFHLLPKFMFKGLMKMCGESDATLQNLLEVRSTGISLERFERILEKQGYKIDKRTIWFIQPNYEVKFKLKKKTLVQPFASIPWLRNFWSTAGYYVVSLK
ncbi:MAG: hypothetical protein FD123_179 [Bacteroidetes bacterium]|nr:MAG: hypothetical protein FD123_179 [Bacteroidota bacterium]